MLAYVAGADSRGQSFMFRSVKASVFRRALLPFAYDLACKPLAPNLESQTPG